MVYFFLFCHDVKIIFYDFSLIQIKTDTCECTNKCTHKIHKGHCRNTLSALLLSMQSYLEAIMAPSLTTHHSLPAGRLKRLLEEKNMLKADLSKKTKVGDNTLNKRTVTKIDAGTPVNPSTLETLRKALNLNSVDDLFIEVDEDKLLQLDFSNEFRHRGWRKGEPEIVQAEEATWQTLLYGRFFSRVEFKTVLDSVTDEQFDLLQRLEKILDRKGGYQTEEDEEEIKAQGLRSGGALTNQLNRIKKQDSYENLLKELKDHNIKVHTLNISFLAMRIDEQITERTDVPYDQRFSHYFKREWKSFFETLIIISNDALAFEVKVPRDCEAPSMEEIQNNPDKFFKIAESEHSEFNINPADRVDSVNTGTLEACYRDGILCIEEDELPF